MAKTTVKTNTTKTSERDPTRNPFFNAGKKLEEKRNLRAQADVPVAEQESSEVETNSAEVVDSVKEPADKNEYDKQVLDAISYVFKNKERKEERTERISVYLTKERKDAFTKKVKKMNSNCNAVLNDLIKFFIDAT